MSEAALNPISAAALDAKFGKGAWTFDVALRDLQSGGAAEGVLRIGARTFIAPAAGADLAHQAGALFEACARKALDGGEEAWPGVLSFPYAQLDPVTLRVLGGAFNAIATQMAHVLYRMSYSSIVRESEDLGCGIFDIEGRELCESQNSPMHIGSLPFYIRGFMRRLAGDIHEGDVIIHNHSYAGASHTPDMAVSVPIFHEGRLVGFAASTAHLLDVGGAAPGFNVDVIDIFAEGKLFNAVKLYERGRRNETVWQFYKDNVRTPDMNCSDIEAMIAAVNQGKKAFIKLLGRYGLPAVMGAANYWMDYSEKRLRAEIAKIPDGVYRSEGWLDDDGKNWGKPLKVAVAVTVKGDGLTIDLTGSAGETPTAFNVPFEGGLLVACYYVVRTLLLDEAELDEFIPQNDGMFRPVEVIAPKGSIFNPNFPRACTTRFCQLQRVIDCVIQALAPALPERVTAGNSAAVMAISYAGFNTQTQQYWMCAEVNEGSYGARATKDGLDSVDNLLANTRNVPIEEIEMQFPLRAERYELRDDPPAPGKYRGGIGVVRANRFLVDGFLSCSGDRHYEAPNGIFGGLAGLPGALSRNPGTAAAHDWPSKVTGYAMKAGDVVQFTGPSGGGLGDPAARLPQSVLDDWLDGHVSLAQAREVYRVAINQSARSVDAAATARLRAGAA